MTPPRSAIPLPYRRLIWVVATLAGLLAIVLWFTTGSRSWFSLGLTVIILVSLLVGPGGIGAWTDARSAIPSPIGDRKPFDGRCGFAYGKVLGGRYGPWMGIDPDGA